MKKILAVIGARPQFIKHAPVELSLNEDFDLITVHTGQHYDHKMSGIFFSELGIRPPTYLLNIGSAGHGIQTGRMMIELEPIVESEMPDAIIVYGDTNSTIAGALVGAKLHVSVIHLEAGLRSFNKNMPEEINRITTDHLSSLLFCPSEQAVENLSKEGITKNVFRSGDVMIDMLFKAIRRRTSRNLFAETPYYFATLHRPYNTDDPKRLTMILASLNSLDRKVIFATHPRTMNILLSNSIKTERFPNIRFIEPLSYFENIDSISFSEAVITDSGGMQKEAYVLRKPCITIRSETEWIETLTGGWNSLVFDDLNQIRNCLGNLPDSHLHHEDIYGDGRASDEIARIIKEYFI